MTDPRKHVLPGQPLALAASQVNFLNSLMQANSMPAAGPLKGWDFNGNSLLVKNTTPNTVNRWGVLKIDGILLDPNLGDTQRREFEAMPCVIGVEPDPGELCVVVLLEPIQPQGIGRAAISGTVQIKMADIAKVGSRSVLWKDEEWALIRLGAHVRLGKAESSWPKGETKVLTQINGDGSDIEDDAIVGDRTFAAVNYFADVNVDCNFKKVACAMIDCTWVLIAAEC